MLYLKEHYQKLCRYMNFTDCGMILGKGCGSPSMTGKNCYIWRCKKIGRGSGFGENVAGLKDFVAADTTVVEGKLLNGRNNAADLKKWLETML